jgi:outer membrane protein OmpA-like peptidoglycan-associated protein
MTGLMMVFMLVAVVFMIQVEALMRKAEKQAQQMKDVAVLYDETRQRLYADLENEFHADLPRWRASLDRDLAIRFEEPDVLFDMGKAELKPQFKKILDDFFPRYVRIIQKYKDSIEEIRIEGHTSSIWNALTNDDEAYFKNMELSQSRTRSALQYVLLLPTVSLQRNWLTAKLTANGLSSSRLRYNPDHTENLQASQRVEFRVRTNAEARIGEILEAAKK